MRQYWVKEKVGTKWVDAGFIVSADSPEEAERMASFTLDRQPQNVRLEKLN